MYIYLLLYFYLEIIYYIISFFTDIILDSFDANVPGGIYTDLYRNGIIEDNLFGRNDVNNRWVGNQSVVYSKIFNGK